MKAVGIGGGGVSTVSRINVAACANVEVRMLIQQPLSAQLWSALRTSHRLQHTHPPAHPPAHTPAHPPARPPAFTCTPAHTLPHSHHLHAPPPPPPLSRAQRLLLNTDRQALTHAAAEADANAAGASPVVAMPLDATSSSVGMGTGGDAVLGKAAALAHADEIAAALCGADLVFVTAGLGGGTGSGAAPVITRLAREAGAIAVAVVSLPFAFEGAARQAVAAAAVTELEGAVDVLVVLENERLLTMLPPETPLTETLRAADDVARQAIVAVASLVGESQLINVDMADVRSVMRDAGRGLISIGRAGGPHRAYDAVSAALSSPLLGISLERGTLPQIESPASPAWLSRGA